MGSLTKERGADLEQRVASLEEDLRIAEAARVELARRAKDKAAEVVALRRDVRTAKNELRRETREPAKELDPVKQAGPGYMKAAREALAALGGQATAADITKQMGAKPGHQVWAIRALVATGEIEETGEKVNRSMTYRFKKGTTRMPPGSGKS